MASNYMLCRQDPKAESPSCCCMAFLNSGMGKHNPQKGLVLTKRFVIASAKIVQNG